LIFWGGALGGTRTPTILLTATSRQRVYQFRHEREGITGPQNGPDQRRRCNKSTMGGQGPLAPQIPGFATDFVSLPGLRLKTGFFCDLKLFLPVQPSRKK
jgi:hypothetical protein